ncbi:MAG TPA: class I SAM-dependent methyltransferase [Acidimicrobiales bacterium]|nr:class I SAM-dependent methyltransferase [Acidimicrobiales bacterium]
MSTDPRDWDAATYDRIADPMTRWGAGVLERLELGGDETVLDAGCGSGRVTELLLGRLPRGHVVAVDAAPSMVAEARRRLARFGDRVSIVEADLLALSPAVLGDRAPVDAVLSTATFHWVLDHDRLFANLASVMRPGAVLEADLCELTPADLGGRAPVDAVLSTATFHWILDHDRLFANLAAVMRPGAALEAQCGAAGNIERLLAAVRAAGMERAGTWLYATPEDTRARLERAGFDHIAVWTHPEPTPLAPGEELETYLGTVCLRAHVAPLGAAERAAVLRRVARAMPEPVIDYVRLNISARRA